MRRARWIIAYLLTASLGLGLALTLSLRLVAPAKAQPAPPPPDGSLPPEFMKDVDSNTPPTAPPSTATPPPAAAQAAPQAPPPPAAEAPPATTTNPPAPGVVNGTAVGTEEYVYDPTGRRDPFRPYKTVRDEKVMTNPSLAKDSKVVPLDSLEPLQRYELDQLSVLGIMWDVRQPRALVKDSDGHLHTVVKNTKMGRANGIVAAIREGEIVVIETVDDEGKTLKRTKVLEFKK